MEFVGRPWSCASDMNPSQHIYDYEDRRLGRRADNPTAERRRATRTKRTLLHLLAGTSRRCTAGTGNVS